MRAYAVIVTVVMVALLGGGMLPAVGAEYLRLFEEEQAFKEEPAPEPLPVARVLVPVPRVTIYPNTLITGDMLEDMDFAAEGLGQPQVYAPREALIGKVARQTLLPHTAVAPSAVREPFTIKQGQPAVAVFQAGALVISATAMPLESGSVGDAINLRNPDSGTTIRGVVQADGTVRVGLP